MPSDPDRAAALTDLRKAYRLVWAYQRQMLDMVQMVADAFGDLSFYRWRMNQCDHPPGQQANPLERWSGDFLPFYDLSFLFSGAGRRQASVTEGDWMLELRIDSDNAYEPREDGEEPDARDFGDAAKASSLLCLTAWKANRDIDRSWHDTWLGLEEAGDEQLDEVVSYDEAPVSSLCMEWDLASIDTHDALEAAIEAFKAALRDRMGLAVA